MTNIVPLRVVCCSSEKRSSPAANVCNHEDHRARWETATEEKEAKVLLTFATARSCSIHCVQIGTNEQPFIWHGYHFPPACVRAANHGAAFVQLFVCDDKNDDDDDDDAGCALMVKSDVDDKSDTGSAMIVKKGGDVDDTGCALITNKNNSGCAMIAKKGDDANSTIMKTNKDDLMQLINEEKFEELLPITCLRKTGEIRSGDNLDGRYTFNVSQFNSKVRNKKWCVCTALQTRKHLTCCLLFPIINVQESYNDKTVTPLFTPHFHGSSFCQS